MAQQPNYAPNVENQTVDYGGIRWKGSPGSGWTQVGFTGQPGLDTAAPDPTAKENQFLSDFSTAIKNQPSASDIYTNLSKTLGLPEAQKAYDTAQNTLNQIPNDTQQLATSMGGISGAQMNERNAVKSQEQAPLVSALANTLGIKNQNLGTLFSGEMQQQQNKLLPFQTQANFLGQNAQLAFNAWSIPQQQQFTQLMTKIQSDQQLSEEEALMANQFAQKLNLYNTNTPQEYWAVQGVPPNMQQLMATSLLGGLGTNNTSGGTGTMPGSW